MTARRGYGLALSLLLAAFVGRVLAQLTQSWRPVGWLPPFAAWHSGVLPYPLLVVFQAVIVGLGLWAIARVWRGRVTTERTGRWLLIAGGVYLAAMAARLILGLTILRRVSWFTAHLPTAFHLVLASFLLVFGLYNLRRRRPEADARV